MPFNASPTTIIPGWSLTNTDQDVTITNFATAFPELSVTEANPDGYTETGSGDVRKVLFAMCKAMYDRYNALATDAKPGKMALFKSISENTTTGERAETYTFRFNTEISGIEVIAE